MQRRARARAQRCVRGSDTHPARWLEFRKQYADELTANEAGVRQLASLAAAGPVTLLYSARDDAHNRVLVLADYMRNFPFRHPPRHNSHSA